MGVENSIKYFISSDTNILYSDDENLKILISEVSSVLNTIRASGKFFLIERTNVNPNEKYYKDILHDQKDIVKKKLINSLEENTILKNKVVVLELFTKNVEVVNNALSNSSLNFRRITEVEEFQLDLAFNSNFNIGTKELEVQIDDAYEKVIENKKTVKKASKLFKESENPMLSFAKAHVMENYTPSVEEISRQCIRYNTHNEKFYIISNLLHLREEKYPLKFIFDLNVELCITFELKSKLDVVHSVKKTIDIEMENHKLKKRVSSVDAETLKNELQNLTDSGTHYNTTLDALFKVAIIIKSKNLDDHDTISSLLTANNIEIYNLDGIHEEARELFNFSSTLNLKTLPSFFCSSIQLAELFVLPPNTIAEEKGVFLGYNKAHKPIYVNFIDQFNGRTSYNFMVDGTMGQGKSNTVKKILSQIYCNPQFKYLYILDPDSEYIDLVNSLGGTVKQYDKSNATNFLHLRIYEGAAKLIAEEEQKRNNEKSTEDIKDIPQNISFKTDVEAAIFEKLQFLNKVFEILIDKEGDSPSYKNDLIISLFNRIYSHYFQYNTSNEYTLSFSESIAYAESNNIFDEYQKKDGNDKRLIGLNDVIAALRTFFEGNGELLDTHSPDISDDIICYDLKRIIGANSVSKKVRRVVMLSTTSQIFYKMSEARETGYMGMLIAEEFNKMVNKHETYLEEFFETCSTRIRKFNFGLGIILHSIHDVAHLSNIFNNILIKIMMYTGDNFEDYKLAYKLSEKEFNVISKPKRSNAYIIAGNARTDATMAENTDVENEIFGKAGGR